MYNIFSCLLDFLFILLAQRFCTNTKFVTTSIQNNEKICGQKKGG